jgi:hypothetical protein
MKRAPKMSPKVPEGLFNEAVLFIVHAANDPAGTVVFGDVLAACDYQRERDPLMTWIVRKPDGAILKIRNGSSAELRRLVARYGGHL